MATRPYGASAAGLCAAEVIDVFLKPTTSADAERGTHATPPSPHSVSIETRYRAVGPTVWPTGGRTDAYDAALEAQCIQLRGAWTFFSAPDPITAWMATRVVDLVHPLAAKRDKEIGDYITQEHLSEVSTVPCADPDPEDVGGWRSGVHCEALIFRRDVPLHVDGGGDRAWPKTIAMLVTLKVRVKVRSRGKPTEDLTLLSRSWTEPTLDGVP
jgi:hypothetical protein